VKYIITSFPVAISLYHHSFKL